MTRWSSTISARMNGGKETKIDMFPDSRVLTNPLTQDIRKYTKLKCLLCL